MRTHFPVELGGIAIVYTLYVEAKNMLKTWPNNRLQRVPISISDAKLNHIILQDFFVIYSLIQRWHTALVAHELIAKDEMNAKEHRYSVITIMYRSFQIFLKIC